MKLVPRPSAVAAVVAAAGAIAEIAEAGAAVVGRRDRY